MLLSYFSLVQRPANSLMCESLQSNESLKGKTSRCPAINLMLVHNYKIHNEMHKIIIIVIIRVIIILFFSRGAVFLLCSVGHWNHLPVQSVLLRELTLFRAWCHTPKHQQHSTSSCRVLRSSWLLYA